MDFKFTQEQIQLKEMVSRFVNEEVGPLAAEYDKKASPKDCFPWPLIEKAMQLGLGSSAVSEEFGGGGLSNMEIVTIMEELSRGDAGFAWTILSIITGAQLITKFGNDEQKKKWLTTIANDPTHRFLMAFAISEPQSGTDNMSPDPTQGVQTFAELKDDNYVLNGKKTFITNAGTSGLYLVWARTDKTKGASQGGLSVFLVTPDNPGMKVGKIEDKLGQRLAQQAELTFDNCIVPKTDMLGKEGMGFPILITYVQNRFPIIGAIGTGIAQAAFNVAYKYAQERVQGGSPIINHQAIVHKLSNMLMAIESTRLMYQKAAWHLDQGQPHMPLTSMCKVAGGETAIMAANEAIQILGGYGYSKEYPAEKLLRDAKALPIYESPNEFQRTRIMFFFQQMEQKSQG